MTDDTERLRAALADRYHIERELGAGGMATVYLAEDLKHHRKVAVKVLRPDLAATLGPERFLREVTIAANLQHPHILPVYDSGEAAGLLYYVMPYVEGPSLRERLNREHELPIPEAARILRDVADAMTAAHASGVVHRDLKPENIMLSGRHALVADFGVAKAVSEATGRQTLTTAGVALGTPTYMAPEQAAADPHTDHRADLYAFGVMAYEMLTGQPPFTGATPQAVLAAHVTEAPVAVMTKRATLPPALAELIMRCLAKRPADRPQSAEELLPLLESWASPSGGITPAQTRPLEAVLAAPGAGPRQLLVLGAIIAAVLLGWFLTSRWEPGRSTAGPGSPATDTVPAVGVLPFSEINVQPGQEFFAEGLTDEVILALSSVTGLRVPGRESSLRFRGSQAPLRAIAETLNVGMLLSGNVQRAEGRIRVRARLVRAADETQVWAGVFDRPERDIFAVYDSVASGIARALAIQLRPDGGKTRRQMSPEAYHAYLQGRVYLANRRIDSAIAFLGRAVALDSLSADAWATLGIAYTLSPPSEYEVATPEAALANARRSVTRALQLDTLSAEAWAAVGRLAGMEFRWDAADSAYARALDLNPGDAAIRHWRAGGLMARGRFTEALALGREAERSDPLSFIIGDWVALYSWLAGEREAALAQGERVLKLHPDNVRLLRDVGLLHARMGNWDRVAELYSQRHLIESGDTSAARRIRDGLLAPATRVATVREIEATQNSYRAPELRMAAGDLEGALGMMRKMVVKPGLFTQTYFGFVTHPELVRSAEMRRIRREAALPDLP